MDKQSPAQPVTELPLLLPLEYCRPERAAKLLKCEVEDLYHWAAIGAINIYTMAQKSERAAKLYLRASDLVRSREQPSGLMYGAYFSVITVEGDLYREPQEDLWCYEDAEISGFWSLRRRHFVQWEQTGKLVEEEDNVIDLSTSYSDKDATSVIWASVTFPNVMEHLWLMREDLVTLQQHIRSGKPLPAKCSNDDIPIAPNEIKRPHPNAERYASTREKRLVAALHVRNRWPDECLGPDKCLSYVAWADAIWNHSHELFGEDYAPLSRDTLERLLSAAEGRNEVYKRS